MARAPFQVLIFPYIKDKHGLFEYALFRRSDGHYWQAIAGGGEEGETPAETAKREIQEETGIPGDRDIVALNSKAFIPAVDVISEHAWGDDTHVIPEYAFAVKVGHKKLKLSKEHIEYKWVSYEEAMSMLKWKSNKNALCELNERLAENH